MLQHAPGFDNIVGASKVPLQSRVVLLQSRLVNGRGNCARNHIRITLKHIIHNTRQTLPHVTRLQNHSQPLGLLKQLEHPQAWQPCRHVSAEFFYRIENPPIFLLVNNTTITTSGQHARRMPCLELLLCMLDMFWETALLDVGIRSCATRAANKENHANTGRASWTYGNPLPTQDSIFRLRKCWNIRFGGLVCSCWFDAVVRLVLPSALRLKGPMAVLGPKR